MNSKINTGGIQIEFVKRTKAVSSGSNSGPQNTKSGASLMKCMDVKGLIAWTIKGVGK